MAGGCGLFAVVSYSGGVSKGAAGSAGRVQLTFIGLFVLGEASRSFSAGCTRIQHCEEAPVAKQLPHRPNLEYLRGQSKRLLTDLKRGNPKAKLAEAQLNIARASGFTSWPALAKHVEQLHALEGEWRFVGLQVDGSDVPGGDVRAVANPDRRRSLPHGIA